MVRLVVFALVLGLASSGQVEAGAPKTGLRFEHVLDLTHTLDGAFPYIPVPGITFPFRLKAIATLEANGVAANSWKIHEHLGTQIDAPNHFAKRRLRNDAFRLAEFRRHDFERFWPGSHLSGPQRAPGRTTMGMGAAATDSVDTSIHREPEACDRENFSCRMCR